MKDMQRQYRRSTMLAVLGLAATLVLSATLFWGCSDTLDGETYDNMRPIVYFANIPPEGQTFSRNPVVYWYGTDEDGLIDYYRYHIATMSAVGALTPEDYIARQGDTDWVYIDVDPASADPQTQQSLSLVADTANPVRGFVSQWVFVQAYDMEGMASEIAYRLFSRNDNPPTTDIFSFYSRNPFVNAAKPGGAVTGISLDWRGEDRIDYPTDPPPFEFQWRLYGPYVRSEMQDIQANFIRPVFQTVDGFIYEAGEEFIVCDTNFAGPTPDVTCDTFVISSASSPPAIYGQMDTMFVVEDPAFLSSAYNRVADSSCRPDPACLESLPPDGDSTDCPCLSEWVLDTRDTIYNVYKNSTIDTTIQKNFIFWIRSRDDAFVPDPTPAFDTLSVIDPKFERDVFVFDFTTDVGVRVAKRFRDKDWNYPGGDRTLTPLDTPNVFFFWKEHLEQWNPEIVFGNQDLEFKRNPFAAGLPLRLLLKYKVVVAWNDHFLRSGILDGSFAKPLWKAIDAGVNVWVTMRAPVYGDPNLRENPDVATINQGEGTRYSFYFAVNRSTYSGWWPHAFHKRDTNQGVPPGFDVQDFMGAYSLRPDVWPSFENDSARAHSMYHWNQRYEFWNPEVPYLTEINWSEARYGAEVMYLYKSHYGSRGQSHPLGVTNPTIQGVYDYNKEGAPVGHRFVTSQFKTVHFNFTPLAIEDENRQAVFDAVMDFLYDPSITTTPTASERYPDAQVKLSLSEQRAQYLKRCDAEALEKGYELSPHALKVLYEK